MNQQELKNFLPKAVIYEVNIRQYTSEGTFNAFAKHLPRLQQMGVNVLWLMPVQPIGEVNRKGSLGSYYAIKNYTDVNDEFGTKEDIRNLIQESHQLGIKVIIDWVANHTAWDHHWVNEHPEYYAVNENGDIVSLYDWSDVVQLDHTNEYQQNAMVQAMKYWVDEFNIDGFRCDMAHLTPLNTWEKAKKQCEYNKPLIWLAETQDTSYFEVFDIIYGWEWLHCMEDVYKGKSHVGALDTIIQHYLHDFYNGKYRILFTSNHDENSWEDTEYKRLGDAAKTFASLCALLPGVPMVYSGQEEPLDRKLHFFDKDHIGFEKYKLHQFYTDLFSIQTTFDCNLLPDKATFLRINTSHNEQFLSFLRKTQKGTLLVIGNLTNENHMVRLYDERVVGEFREFLNHSSAKSNFNIEMLIKAWEIKIYIQ